MRQPLQRTLHDGVRRLNHLFTASGIILLYHRIADATGDPYVLTVSPAHFEQHLAVIRKLGTPMHLDELAEALRRGRPIRRAVCITFDDAYQDNLYTAKPLLETHDLPATVYATTGCGRDREFWWDELARIFLSPGPLPAHLELAVDGRTLSRELGPSAGYEAAEWDRYRGWTFEHDQTPTDRHAAFVAVYERLRPLPHSSRTRALDDLMAWAGQRSAVRPEYRALEPDELVALESGGLISVGAHTVNHPSLPRRPPREQSEEISRSRRTLEEWLGHPIRSFAYPYGHVDPTSVAAVREAGFDHACSCRAQPVRRSSDLLALPRIEVHDWDGAFLDRRLRWYLGV